MYIMLTSKILKINLANLANNCILIKLIIITI